MANCTPGVLRVFRLFENKSNKPDEVVIREIKKTLFREVKQDRRVAMFMMLHVLLRSPKHVVEKITSPLRILLQHKIVDPNALTSPPPPHKDAEQGSTALHCLAEAAMDLENMENQVLLGQQLLDAGADVNARAGKALYCHTPLHVACMSSYTTNLDFIKLLLDNGADPNAQSTLGETPLMYTMNAAPGACKFVVEYKGKGQIKPDLNIRNKKGETILSKVKKGIDGMVQFNLLIAPKDRMAATKLLVQQLEELQGILLERNATF
eukprot:CAMPEP_0119006428 /NCGR_PEP_ID=MMETSP1176-20130426/2286_1 /TAXON_ID=265551 /ORGANISM="Synedropsis recta cf, Strain CCMP1620" /LENGTH=264 /DNA_ID=CAMNT_0006958337 /DNA_START=134 /DNA_END=928 /DNA_ORIENTATION=-